MNISQYFPFLKECQVIKSYTVDAFDLHDPRYLTFNPYYNETNKDKLQKLMDISGLSIGASVQLVRIMPNDIYTYIGTDEALSIILTSSIRPNVVKAQVVELDYGRLSNEIEIHVEESKALLTKGSDYISEKVITDTFITDAKLGIRSEISEELKESINSHTLNKQLNEDEVDDIFSMIPNEISIGAVNGEPPFYELIKLYLQSDNATEKIPLLVGMSGIAKSAMVNDLAKELGMRMVDLRVSFMSRLDIDGLSEIIGKEFGEPRTLNAPMVEFLTCTDEYIEFSQKAIPIIESKIVDLRKLEPTDDVLSKISDLEIALAHFTEAAKTPVLFFDEITRSDKSIRGALTTIINQRIYNQYHLKKARMIAATNAPVGYEDDPDMQDMFIGATLEDVAVLDRFNKIPLSPEEVYPKWLEYIRKAFHPLVVEYIEQYPDQAYDISSAVEKAHDYEREDDLIPPYPTYRAWENISDYLKSRTTSTFNNDILEGLLGKNAKQFAGFLRYKGYSESYTDAGESKAATMTMQQLKNCLPYSVPNELLGYGTDIDYSDSNDYRISVNSVVNGILHDLDQIDASEYEFMSSKAAFLGFLEPSVNNELETTLDSLSQSVKDKIKSDALMILGKIYDLAVYGTGVQIEPLDTNDPDLFPDPTIDRDHYLDNLSSKLYNAVLDTAKSQNIHLEMERKRSIDSLIKRVATISFGDDIDSMNDTEHEWLINSVKATLESRIKSAPRVAVNIPTETPAGHLDRVTDFISDSLDAGLPTMIMGVSGLGKTTRIREYCEERGYGFELISLATKDRLDIMGPPAKVDITKYIAKDSSSVFDELGLTEELSKLKSECGLPNSVTVRSPKSELQSKIQKCVDSGKPLVLFFDEFNRCIDPTVQSAVFQAISDGQFGGVKFKKGQVKIALAGNLGETTREAGRVDGALTARAVQMKKLSYDESDAMAVIQYMRSHDYAQSLIEYIGNDTNKVLELIKTVDEGSLTSNVSSTRSLKALSDVIKESESSPRLHGALLCPDEQAIQEYNMSGGYDIDIFETMLKRVHSKLKSWAALGTYDYPGGTDLNVAIDAFNKGYELYMSGNKSDKLRVNLATMITNFLSIDSAISAYRSKTFSYYVDSKFAQEFVSYYNLTSGTSGSGISIDDLTNIELIMPYVTSSFIKLDASTPKWSTLVKSLYDHHKSALPVDNYIEFIYCCVKQDTSLENSRSEMKNVLSYSELTDIVSSYEQNPSNLIKLATAFGFSRSDVSYVAKVKTNTVGVI